MNKYRLRSTGQVVTEAEYRALTPNISYPAVLVPEDADVVFPAPQPAFDAVIRTCIEVAPTLTVKGTYEQTWQVVPRFAEYTDADDVTHTVAEQELAAQEAAQATALAATQARYTAALEALYDTTAQSRKYDNRLTCALRAGYAGPFQAEGTAFAVWMDTCNMTAYDIMGQVLAGDITMPSIAELLAMMPTMEWPA